MRLLLLLLLAVLCAAKWDVREHLADQSPYAPMGESEIPPLGCQKKYMYGVVRHGSRWPFDSTMHQFDQLEQKIREHLQSCSSCPSWLRNWRNTFYHETPGDLLPSGQAEMDGLGRRIRSDPDNADLFSEAYQTELTKGQPALMRAFSSALPHTSRSGSALMFGLLQTEGAAGGSAFYRPPDPCPSPPPVPSPSPCPSPPPPASCPDVECQCSDVTGMTQETDAMSEEVDVLSTTDDGEDYDDMNDTELMDDDILSELSEIDNPDDLKKRDDLQPKNTQAHECAVDAHDDFIPVFVDSSSACSDILIRYFKSFWWSCPELKVISISTKQKQMDTNTQGKQAFSYYLSGAADRLTREWGMRGEWNVTVGYVNYMMIACTAEIAKYNDSSKMCSLFTQQEIEGWEYAMDVSTYYSLGYGFAPAYESAAPLLKDIYANMRHVIENDITNTIDRYQKVRLRFGHHQTLLPLLALLDLYKDAKKLKWSSSNTVIQERKWRTSQLSPFGANLFFSLYECPQQEYMVKLTHNERDLRLPHCNNTVYCNWRDMWDPYERQLEDSFESVCVRHGGEYIDNEFEDLCVESLPESALPEADHCSATAGYVSIETLSYAVLAAAVCAFLAGFAFTCCVYGCAFIYVMRERHTPGVHMPVRDPYVHSSVHHQPVRRKKIEGRKVLGGIDKMIPRSSENTDFSKRLASMKEQEGMFLVQDDDDL